MVGFKCSKCGTSISVAGKPKTATCPSCGTTYTLTGNPNFDWGTFFWGAVAGMIFSFFIFTATGRQIMEALGYEIRERVKR